MESCVWYSGARRGEAGSPDFKAPPDSPWGLEETSWLLEGKRVDPRPKAGQRREGKQAAKVLALGTAEKEH